MGTEESLESRRVYGDVFFLVCKLLGVVLRNSRLGKVFCGYLVFMGLFSDSFLIC